MPFSGFKNFKACEMKMVSEGYGKKSQKKICGYLKHNYEDKK